MRAVRLGSGKGKREQGGRFLLLSPLPSFPLSPSALVYATIDGLEIPPLGHVGEERVVRGGAADLEYLRLSAGLERRPLQHHQEVRFGNEPGTRAGEEEAARGDRLQRKAV